MAYVQTYPVPVVRKNKHSNMWRVTWADTYNSVWFCEFYEWRAAIRYATRA